MERLGFGDTERLGLAVDETLRRNGVGESVVLMVTVGVLPPDADAVENIEAVTGLGVTSVDTEALSVSPGVMETVADGRAVADASDPV